MSKSLEHPEDHAHAVTGGQGDPSLAIGDAEQAVGWLPRRPQRFRWPWQPREIALGYGTARISAGCYDGRPYVAVSDGHKPLGYGDKEYVDGHSRRTTIIWLDGLKSAAHLHDAIDAATQDAAAFRHGWRKVGQNRWQTTIKVNLAEPADGTGGDPSPPLNADEISGTTP